MRYKISFAALALGLAAFGLTPMVTGFEPFTAAVAFAKDSGGDHDGGSDHDGGGHESSSHDGGSHDANDNDDDSGDDVDSDDDDDSGEKQSHRNRKRHRGHQNGSCKTLSCVFGNNG